MKRVPNILVRFGRALYGWRDGGSNWNKLKNLGVHMEYVLDVRGLLECYRDKVKAGWAKIEIYNVMKKMEEIL